MKITNIYRYPIKSFSKEEKNEVEITDFNRIVGDRIAAFKIGENTKNYEWLPKKNYLSLTVSYTHLTLPPIYSE